MRPELRMIVALDVRGTWLLVVALVMTGVIGLAYRRRRLAVRASPTRASADVPGVGMAARLKTTSL